MARDSSDDLLRELSVIVLIGIRGEPEDNSDAALDKALEPYDDLSEDIACDVLDYIENRYVLVTLEQWGAIKDSRDAIDSIEDSITPDTEKGRIKR